MRRTVLIIALTAAAVLPAAAQYFSFGHNKVQYTEFDWQILRTEHFDIYYYPEMKELAQQGAFFAEEAYSQLQVRFNHSVIRRIPLIFYSSHLHFQQTNTTGGFIPEGVGGFFEFLKGRVVIPSDGSLSRFRHVIRHELVHVFMHSKVSRVLMDHRLPYDRMPPLWFTEGLAEVWSTHPDDQSEMLIRDAVLNNYIVPLQNMEAIYGTFLMYKQGQYILKYIEETYGEEKLLLLMENFWKSTSFNEVMKATIGKSYKELDEEWIYAFKKRYYPVLADADFTSRIASAVVKKGFNTKPLYFRNDSLRQLLFIGNHTGYTSIYRTNLDAKKDEERELIQVVEGEKSDEFESFHVFQSRMDITRSGLLAFVTKKGETDALHLYDILENRLVRTLQFPGLVVYASPNWSSDDTKLVFAASDKAGRMDLYTYDLPREELKRITNDPYDDRDPVWTPDGQAVIFSSDRTPDPSGETYNLFKAEVSGGAVTAVTDGRYNAYAPSYSPDGKYLTYTSNIDGAQNIWALPAASVGMPGSRAVQVTDFTGALFDPQWTDKDELLFSGFENYSFKIYSLSRVSERIDTSRQSVTMALPAVAAWVPKVIDKDSTVKFEPYMGEYSLDIAQSQVSTDPIFGTVGGAALAASDVLGNDQYHFLLYNNAQVSDEFLGSFNLAVTRVSLGQRMNYATGIFHFAGRRYDLTDPDLYYYERNFGGYFVLSYPLSKFQRVESGISLSNSDKDNYLDLMPRKALILSNSVTFVHDNSLWMQTGPIDGSRFIATLAYTQDVQYGNVGYYTAIADARFYNRISERSAFASRFMLTLNEGQEARRFFMGGSWDMRGYYRFSIRGKRMWFTSHEFRFPFVDQLNVKLPFMNLGFGSFRGAAFFDAGSAWDNKYKETLGSIGGGLRWSIGGFLVLRYDVGKRITHDLSRLQKGLFYQFFFGWDF
ncbi:MAG: PD40 domain-containing protein [Bacteroidetes bacterium]|nr:PD40 domain-containing protein [Bacteroidota bacterium]